MARKEDYAQKDIDRDESTQLNAIERLWNRLAISEFVSASVWTDYENEIRHIVVVAVDDGLDYLWRLVEPFDQNIIQFGAVSFEFSRDTEAGTITIDVGIH